MASAFAMPVAVLLLVLRLGVNIPFSDEWDWSPIILHAQNGTLTFDEVWRQHNEHRMIVTSAILIAFVKLSGGWNLVHEEIASVALCVASQITLLRIIRRSVASRHAPLACAIGSLMLWNVGQAENFAMGLQIGWFVLQLGELYVVLVLTARLRAGTFALAVVAAVISSFCSEIGLLVWPSGFIAIVLAHGWRARTFATTWLACCACTYIAFCAGLVGTTHGHAAAGSSPSALLAYAVAYLGLPAAFWAGLPASIVTGSTMLVLIAVFAVSDVRSARMPAADHPRRAEWYALAAFAILGAIGTAPNRLGLGLDGVVTSTRYILVSVWLSIAVLMIAIDVLARIPPRYYIRKTLLEVLVCSVALATCVASARGVRDWQHFSMARFDDIGALQIGRRELVAPYYANRSVLDADIDDLCRVRNGPALPINACRSASPAAVR